MKKIIALLTILVAAFSCANETYLFADKKQEEALAQHSQALLGRWAPEKAPNDQFMVGFERVEEGMALQTPSGTKMVQNIQPVGALGLAIHLTDGNVSRKVMAQFTSYQRTTLVLMNSEGLDLGIGSQYPLVLRKTKEETVTTASSMK
ncbi:hypothetical protein [Roseivirga thermotolerans]|uniref:hypothetical protein n=1 Tax=Roseivirga thermotolerans TaxID=1758176 RepID=UPI00273D661D|nr:hypothetical protein [Roseivirga thermotolerans]